MPACLILGDSIALGIAAALHAMHLGGCDIRARVGASVETITAMVSPLAYRSILVSAGSNDHLNRGLGRALDRLRTRLADARVTWIYPRQAYAAWSVYRVAYRYGDRTVDIGKVASRDGVHPRDYVAAARMVLSESAARK